MKAGAATPQRGSWGEGGAAKEAREPDKEGEPSPHAALSLGSHGLDFFDRDRPSSIFFRGPRRHNRTRVSGLITTRLIFLGRINRQGGPKIR